MMNRNRIKNRQPSKSLSRVSLTIALNLSAAALSLAEETKPAPDKSRYSIFNPTPKDSMRELTTDRPDKTESPYTVDAGHFQIEMDVVTYEHDRDTAAGANTVSESWGFAPVNLKVGLCNTVDLQLVLDTYGHVRTEDRVASSVTKQQGFGDITTRLKVNFWGNDGGDTAFGAMPFVKFPTSQDNLGNHSVEGGLILPLALKLGHGFDMGWMTEFDVVRNSANNDYHAEFVNSVTIGHDIVGKLGGYVEFWSLVSRESGSQWQATVDVGLTYGLTDKVQIDCGANFGVTKSTPDLQLFTGISLRF